MNDEVKSALLWTTTQTINQSTFEYTIRLIDACTGEILDEYAFESSIFGGSHVELDYWYRNMYVYARQKHYVDVILLGKDDD